MNKRKYIVIGLYVALIILLPITTLFVLNDVKIPNKLIPQDVDRFSREYIATLKRNDIEKAATLTVPQANISRDQLTQFTSFFISGLRIETLKIVGVTTSNSSTLGNGKYYQMSYEAENATGNEYNKFIVLHINTLQTENGLRLIGFNGKGSSKSIKEASTFDFGSHGVYFIIAILTPVFVIYTAIYYIRKSPRPRWRILFLILLLSVFISISTVKGVFRGGINVGVHGLIQKNGSGDPLTFNVQVPLGAIYYWIARKKINSKEQSLPTNT